MQDILANHRLSALLMWLCGCVCPTSGQGRLARETAGSQLYAQMQIEEAVLERQLAQTRRTQSPETSAAAICTTAARLCTIAARVAEHEAALRCQRAEAHCETASNTPPQHPADSE